MNCLIYLSIGGIETSVRKDAWQFLFGLYPCVSTARFSINIDHCFKHIQGGT